MKTCRARQRKYWKASDFPGGGIESTVVEKLNSIVERLTQVLKVTAVQDCESMEYIYYSFPTNTQFNDGEIIGTYYFNTPFKDIKKAYKIHVKEFTNEGGVMLYNPQCQGYAVPTNGFVINYYNDRIEFVAVGSFSFNGSSSSGSRAAKGAILVGNRFI